MGQLGERFFFAQNKGINISASNFPEEFSDCILHSMSNFITIIIGIKEKGIYMRARHLKVANREL